MDTQKWELWIRHRVNQVADQELPQRLDLVILAAEGHDTDFAPLARQFADAVAVQSRAVDQKIGLKIARRRRGHPTPCCRPQRRNVRARDHLSALCGDLFLQHRAHSGIIYDALLRHMQRSHPAGVRFDLPHLFPLQQPQSLQPVLLTALLQGVQARQLRLVHSHDQFATHLMRDVLLAAEGDHLLNA